MVRYVAGKPPFFYLSILALFGLYLLRLYQLSNDDSLAAVNRPSDILFIQSLAEGRLFDASRKNRSCATKAKTVRREECECWAKLKHQKKDFAQLGNDSTYPLVKEESNGVIINPFLGEITYEVAVMLPLLHYYHKNNKLISSSSCDDVQSFYFFCKNHTLISNCQRINNKKSISAYESELGPLSSRPSHPHFLPPPLKRAYCGCPSLWDKIKNGSKVVILTNRFVKEWQGQPLNFINMRPLVRIVGLFLTNGFVVVYNRPETYSALDKPRHISKRNDFSELVSAFGKSKNFIFMHSLASKHPSLSLDEVTIRTMALSRCFLSVKGEPSLFSSYFGGWNVVLSRIGHEARDGDYANFYHRFSGARVDHAKSVDELEAFAEEMATSLLCSVYW